MGTREENPAADNEGGQRRDVPEVLIDRKGRQYVRAKDLAESQAFRDRLDEMAKLAESHAPRSKQR